MKKNIFFLNMFFKSLAFFLISSGFGFMFAPIKAKEGFDCVRWAKRFWLRFDVLKPFLSWVPLGY